MPGIYDTSTEDRQIKKKFEQFERKVNRKGLDGNKDKPSKKIRTKKENTMRTNTLRKQHWVNLLH